MTHFVRVKPAAPPCKSNWSDLPNELMTLISKDPKLSSHSLKAMRLVCRNWRSAIDQGVTKQTICDLKDVAKTLHFSNMESLRIRGEAEPKARAVHTHSEVQLNSSTDSYSANLEIEQLNFEVLKPLKKLEQLRIERVHDLTANILNSVTELNRLKSLTISDCSNVELSSLENIGQLSKLQTLQIHLSPDKYSEGEFHPHRDEGNAESTLAMLSQLRELRNFKINGYAPAAISQLSRFEQNNIAKLAIDNLNVDMVQQLSHWPNLQELTVYTLGINVVPVLGQLKQIQSFAFRGIDDYEKSFANFRSMRSLRKLKIGPAVKNYKDLNTITQLTSLELSNAVITCRGAITDRKSIFPLPNLQKAVLKRQYLDKAEFISSLKGIQSLQLSQVILSVEAIKELSSLSELRALKIKKAVFPKNFDLSHLPKLNQLTSLSIGIFKTRNKYKFPCFVYPKDEKKLKYFSSFGSNGVNTLKHFAQLTELTLSGFSLNSKQIHLVNSIPSLKKLAIRDSKVPQQVIENLVRQKPRLAILNKDEGRAVNPEQTRSYIIRSIRNIKIAFFRVFNWLGFGPRSLRD